MRIFVACMYEHACCTLTNICCMYAHMFFSCMRMSVGLLSSKNFFADFCSDCVARTVGVERGRNRLTFLMHRNNSRICMGRVCILMGVSRMGIFNSWESLFVLCAAEYQVSKNIISSLNNVYITFEHSIYQV